MNRVMQTLEIYTILYTMNSEMDCWVSYFLYIPSSPQTKSKPMKKHRLRTTALTSHELMAIAYNSFGALQRFPNSSGLGK